MGGASRLRAELWCCVIRYKVLYWGIASAVEFFDMWAQLNLTAPPRRGTNLYCYEND